MPLLLLIRHGENDYAKTDRAAGRLPRVHLNEKGLKQAQALAEALKDMPLKAVYSSPLERAMETAEPIAKIHNLKIYRASGLLESDIGKWQGRSWKSLRLTKAWKIVQNAPSRFRFPGGESFPEMQIRIVNTLEEICARHKKPQDIIACVFHADPIKLAVAHYIGLPLDHFQRLGCDTGSVTLLSVNERGAHLMWMNRRPPFDLPVKKS
jgi:probable phosphoglycerate mutase